MARVGVSDLLSFKPQHCITHPRPFIFTNFRINNRRLVVRVAADKSEGSFPENFINQISVAVTNFSPANAVKKAIAAAQAGQYDEGEISRKLDAYIRDNSVVVFSWTRCPFCVKAKRQLDSMEAKYLAVELDTMADGNAIRSELAKEWEVATMALD